MNERTVPPVPPPRVRVYLASSLDGFIAGDDDDLSWLPEPAATDETPPGALDFPAFLEQVGALLMGRRTWEVVRSFGIPWPYGDRPVLVASHRPLEEDAPATVRRVEGDVAALVEAARAAAGERDVYLDGGELVRQACAVGMVDELTLTFAPVALGSGRPLFAGLGAPYRMELAEVHRFPGGMVQLRLVPVR